MAKVFEVGKTYGANDILTYPVKIVKRTAKMVEVEEELAQKRWRMRIRKHENGDEYITDSMVPKYYRDSYTWEARLLCE